MWIDLHQHDVRERHARFVSEAEIERLAVAARPERRCRRLRLGRLQISWNCAVAALDS
jgi:hypothetical protein